MLKLNYGVYLIGYHVRIYLLMYNVGIGILLELGPYICFVEMKRLGHFVGICVWVYLLEFSVYICWSKTLEFICWTVQDRDVYDGVKQLGRVGVKSMGLFVGIPRFWSV